VLKQSNFAVFYLILLFLTLVGASFGIAIPVIAFWLGALLFMIEGTIFAKQVGIAAIFESVGELLRQPLLWIACITLASFGFSSFFGIKPDISGHKWMIVVAIALGGAIWFLGVRRWGVASISRLPMIALWLALIVSLYAWGYVFHWKFFVIAEGRNALPYSIQKISSLLAIIMPFALLRVLPRKSPYEWGMLCLCATTAFMCGGRSGIVAYIAMTCIFAFYFPWGQIKHWGHSLARYVGANIFAGIIGTVAYFIIVGEKQFMRRVVSERAATGSGRTDIWQFSWDKFQDHPVFGIGVQAFRYLDFTGVKLSSTLHPHNITVEILLETGFVGLLSLTVFSILALYKTIWQAHRHIMTDPNNLRVIIMATGVSLFSYFTAGQFLTSFFHGWWLVVPTTLFALLGAVTFIYRHGADQTRKSFASHPHEITVTIVMPCFNGEAYLKQAIASVQYQTIQDWELIIVNDGSTDSSQNIINEYKQADARIKSITHKTSMGAGAARNAGLDAARGRYVAFLDCDDIWKQSKLECQIAAMDQTGAALSTTHYDIIDDGANVIGQVTPRDHVFTFGRLLKCNDIGCSSAMIDREQVKSTRFPDFRRAQDFIFWCEILRHGNLCLCIHENLGAYRVHSRSRTLNKFEAARNRIRLMRDALQVPALIIPYYLVFYILYGVLKQVRSGVSIIATQAK